jgi:hypothetical protein
MDIGRPDGMTKGTVTECDSCGEGSLVIERRNGRIINSICTNITCELHPEGFNLESIVGHIYDWIMHTEENVDFKTLSEAEILSLAHHLFENLKL